MKKSLRPGAMYRIEYGEGWEKPFFLDAAFGSDYGQYTENGVRLKLYGLGVSQIDTDSLLNRAMASGGVNFIPALTVNIAMSDS